MINVEESKESFGNKQDQECQVENEIEEIKSAPSSSSYLVQMAESKTKNSLVSFGYNSAKVAVGIQTNASQTDEGPKKDVVDN